MTKSVSILVLASFVAAAQPNRPKFVEGQIIVQERRGADPALIDRAMQVTAGPVLRHIPQTKHHVLRVPEPQVDRIMKTLMKSGLFSVVERDGLAYPSAVPNDPSFPSQWHLAKIQADIAWNSSTGSAAPIAVVDSGVDPTHPDLAGRLVAGWNFVSGGSDTHDIMGHGTAVAGTIAAIANNGTGVSGVTWKNPIMPIVVVDSSGSAQYSAIAAAINYAADSGVRIINVSISGSTPSSAMQSAIAYAWSKGAVVFAAAGNSSSSAPFYPAACDNAVAVSATDENDNMPGWSNYGSWIDLAAPGNNVLTTSNGGGYGYWSGTSFSSPVAAGVAALVLALKPTLSPSGLISILEQNTDDLGTAGYDQWFGFGRVNAAKAVGAVGSNTIMVVPTVIINSPAANATVSGTVNVTGSASDPLGISRVDVYCDGVPVGSSTSGNFSVAWNTASVAAGAHTIQVTATDAGGNAGSAAETVNVATVVKVMDVSAPTVKITTPASGAAVSGTISVTASATDDTAVQQVSIYIDGTLVYTGSTAPYTYRWNTKKASNGTHVITANAWDNAGNIGSAAPVTVTKVK